MWEKKFKEEETELIRSFGVIGNITQKSIQGDITEQIEKVTASAENLPNEAAENLIDGGNLSKWLAFDDQVTLTFTLSKAENIVKYVFTSANDAPRRDPQDWTLAGSNDLQSWTEIDRRTNESFAQRGEKRIFELADNQASYKHYRFTIKNAGDKITQLAGLALSNGIDVAETDLDNGMKIFVGDGPRNSYTGKRRMGWTSTNALIYQGTQHIEGNGYAFHKLYDEEIKVEADTELSYLIHPEFVDKLSQNYASTYVALDLAFTDGMLLSELDPVDQYGYPFTARAQGESNILYPNQWNLKRINLGEIAEGKTIESVLLSYHNPAGPGMFRGAIDAIKIAPKPTEEGKANVSDYVNILRGSNSNGTFSRGNNLPAVAVPHGFNFWAPATNTSNDWVYSYQQDNNADNLPELEAFALSHQPSGWMGDRHTFHIMPAQTANIPPLNRKERALAFRHDHEIAKAHYYSVLFENGIQTEMTPTDRAAMFRFTFTEDAGKLIFDNMRNEGGLTIDQENQALTSYTDVKSGLSTGASRMFIYATFDVPFIESGRLTGEDRDDVAGYIGFDTTKNKTVTMKIATSLISIEQAQKNLAQEIEADATFDDVKERAQALWDDQLSIIDVDGATREELVTVYSNLYRLFLYPNKAYENTGTVENPVYQYAHIFEKSPNHGTATEAGVEIVNGKLYVNNGFWDTYRTTWPAYALLSPTKAGEMVDGFVEHYREGGWISRWSSPGFADLMVGTSSDVAFSDVYLKGIDNFDVKAFYESAIKNAAVASSDKSVGRKGLETSVFDGFTSTSTDEGLSWAMDGYINDFAIAQLAKKLATDSQGAEKERYETDYEYYLNRAQNYIHVFNPETQFFMGKHLSGEWRIPTAEFDPGRWGPDYTETNAWNMAFHAPQDGQGLATLYGGREALGRKLDQFFSVPETGQPGSFVIHEMTEARDVRMGMYAHSNQPSHHITYMYNYAGMPWKAQEKISEVMSRLYVGSEIGQGYPGDEDNGEMSAWYLFSAAGFYPVQVGRPEYMIGTPKFKKMTIHLENGEKLVIHAPNVSMRNKYVQGLKVNGEPYEKLTIPHEVLAAGATLEFDLGAKPSNWGVEKKALPSSIANIETDRTILPLDPLHDLTTITAGMPSDHSGGTAEALFDNTSATTLTLKGDKPWVQYQFVEQAERVQMYTMTSAENEVEDPKTWRLLGSTDEESWHILDERENIAFAWRKFTRPFKVAQPGNYKYYRLEILENNGAKEVTSLAEIELLGYEKVAKKVDFLMAHYRAYVETGKLEEEVAEKIFVPLKKVGIEVKNSQFEVAMTDLKAIKQIVDQAGINSKIKASILADLTVLEDAIEKQM